MADLNNRGLAHAAATKIVNDSAIGKALAVSTPGVAQQEANRRKEVMVAAIAKIIAETYAPWCNEEFR